MSKSNIGLDVYSLSWWLIAVMLQPARVVVVSLRSVPLKWTPILDEGSKL